jgi:hypothetical protein
MPVAYTVTATLPDEATAVRYIEWLQGGHIDRVLGGGAHSGLIVRLDAAAGARPRVQTQYVFATRDGFARYLSDHAPALRAEGLERFPPASGVTFERTVGDIVWGARSAHE